MNSIAKKLKQVLLIIVCLSPGISFAQTSSFVVPLWANGAPGFENRKNEPEQAKDWWVKNIHNPSITVFPAPKDKATGAAIVVCPGGGHRELVFNPEGKEAADFLNSIGVTAIVLKYRLFREDNSPYTIEHPKQDIFRAMRLVRSRASEWNIDTARLGVMGFSAGGEVAAWVAYANDKGNPLAKDVIDRLPARPSFEILIYPGPGAVPDSVNPNAPSAFLLAANDDPCCSGPIIDILRKHREAKVPAEVHLYAQAGHAFNMGLRSKLTTIHSWPQRLADWLGDNGWLKKK